MLHQDQTEIVSRRNYYKGSKPFIISSATAKPALAVIFLICAFLFWLTHGFGLLNLQIKEKLSDYSWAELKDIAVKIENSETIEIGQEIAIKYHILQDNGLPDPANTKRIELRDGKTYEIRVLGVLQDEKAHGAGKAGITFQFSEPVGKQPMNNESRNEGGWKTSEMRLWVNSDFRNEINRNIIGDINLTNYIVAVEKIAETSNRPDSVPDTTVDDFWIQSLSEFERTHNKLPVETSQIIDYSKRPTISSVEIVDGPMLWTRSIAQETDDCFLAITPKGKTIIIDASHEAWVLPTFCY